MLIFANICYLLSPPIMSDIFTLSENSSYNLRCGVTMNRWNMRTSKFGFETVSTIGAILWNDLPAELKNVESLKILKQKIRFWSPNNCPWEICRKSIKNLGCIQYQKSKKNFLLINFKAFEKKTCSKFSKLYYLRICIGCYTFCYYHC